MLFRTAIGILATIAFGAGATSSAAGHQVAQTDASVEFPIAVGESGHYLVDAQRAPVLLRGATPWMLDKLVESDVDLYIADSAAKGFNYLQLMTPTSPPYGTANAYGAEPFVGAPFTTAINPDYWSHVEYIVDAAARYGIIVALVPAWIGYLPELGYSTEITAATDADMTAYGEALIGIFGDKPNIIWDAGHDNSPVGLTPEIQERFGSMFTPIRASGQLVMISADYGNVASDRWYTWTVGTDFDIDTVYEWLEEPAAHLHPAWAKDPARPVIFFEGRYEAEEPHPSAYTNEPLYRNQIWGAFGAGAAGLAYGSSPEYHFENEVNPTIAAWQGTWQDALNYPLRLEMEVFSDWIDGVGDQWAELVPDLTGMFLISGERTGYERSVVRWSASKQSGVLAVAYRAAGGGALEFDLSQLAPSRVVISKLDPVTGVKTTFASRTNTGIFTASLPRRNAAGDDDWVIVFESA